MTEPLRLHGVGGEAIRPRAASLLDEVGIADPERLPCGSTRTSSRAGCCSG